MFFFLAVKHYCKNVYTKIKKEEYNSTDFSVRLYVGNLIMINCHFGKIDTTS